VQLPPVSVNVTKLVRKVKKIAKRVQKDVNARVASLRLRARRWRLRLAKCSNSRCVSRCNRHLRRLSFKLRFGGRRHRKSHGRRHRKSHALRLRLRRWRLRLAKCTSRRCRVRCTRRIKGFKLRLSLRRRRHHGRRHRKSHGRRHAGRRHRKSHGRRRRHAGRRHGRRHAGRRHSRRRHSVRRHVRRGHSVRRNVVRRVRVVRQSEPEAPIPTPEY